MIKVYSREYTEYVESNALGAKGNLSSLELCEQLANAFCAKFRMNFGDHRKVIVFAGPGRNGAVALAISRILLDYSESREVVLLNPTGLLSDDCATNARRLRDTGVALREVTTSFHPPVIHEEDIVIDGICGIELNVPFDGSLAMVAQYINKRASTVVSIDVPSGLMSENNEGNLMDHVVRATYTYTFYGPKLSFFLRENAEYVGKWQIIDIRLDDGGPNKMVTNYLFSVSDMDGRIPPRPRFSNKYDYGRVALIAGSKGMMGAAILAGRACMRSGAGHLTIHVPAGLAQTIHSSLPEALVDEDMDGDHFSVFSGADRYDAIAVGPGLGRHFSSAAALEALLGYYKKPMVLDADAIHLLAANESLLDRIPQDSILTPHSGEFDALAGESLSDYERLQKAKEFAQKYRVNLVLKGAYTAICSKQGRIFFNTTGNPGMATAGTGDVLTGSILALLGRGFQPLLAALVGVFVNGYAGDRYAEDFSAESLMASDVIDYLPKVFKYFKSDIN